MFHQTLQKKNKQIRAESHSLADAFANQDFERDDMRQTFRPTDMPLEVPMIDTGGSGALDGLDEDMELYLQSPVQLLTQD